MQTNPHRAIINIRAEVYELSGDGKCNPTNFTSKKNVVIDGLDLNEVIEKLKKFMEKMTPDD